MFQKDKDVSATAKRTRDEAAEVHDLTREGTRTLRDLAHDAGARVQDFIDEKQHQVHDVRVSAERQIRANPLTAAAIAFAGGLIISSLLRRH